MSLSLPDFIQGFTSNPALAITAILTLGVIFVNGWTDAPNAIATCVSTRAMRPRAAILMAAIFNFFGVFVMTKINSKVAQTLYNMVDFTRDEAGLTEAQVSRESLIALCAALFAIVLWAVMAWYFGIPTSESHALIAGLSGAAIALHNSLAGIQAKAWGLVLLGLVFSSLLGFGMGWLSSKLVILIFRYTDRAKSKPFFRGGQIAGGAAMAFMHGAQDGQKFMGVFLLGITLAGGNPNVNEFFVPTWLMVLCSLVMGVGTSIGGYRIIKSVGMDMVKLETHQGFAADIAAAFCLLISSISGVPVSTTHTKTTAMMGVGAAKRFSAVNWSVVKEMVLAWVLTFPGCGLVGFVMVKLFLVIFK